MNLGDKLLELRKKKGLSQEEVAYELNVTRQTVSKWETNQTTPDFDKIAPLCKLYDISTDELLTGKMKEEKNNITIQPDNKRKAVILSISIFLYFFAVALLIFSIEVVKLTESFAVSIFLIICAIATCLIVYQSSLSPKKEKTEKAKKDNKLYKQIENIVSSITLILYLIISFSTMAWHITWILWIINALICEIIKLFFMLKGESKDEK